MTPHASILVPTQGRIGELRDLLSSLAQMAARDRIAHEIIVANNAPAEPAAQRVEELVTEYSAREPGVWHHRREPLGIDQRELDRSAGWLPEDSTGIRKPARRVSRPLP